MLERLSVILSFTDEKPDPADLVEEIKTEFEIEKSLSPEDAKNEFLNKEEIEDIPDKIVEYLESELGDTHRIKTPKLTIEVSPWGVRIAGDNEDLDDAAEIIGEILDENGVEYEPEEDKRLTLDSLSEFINLDLENAFGDDFTIGSFQVKGSEGNVMVDVKDDELYIRGEEKILRELDNMAGE